MIALVAMLTSVVAVCVYDFGSHVDLLGGHRVCMYNIMTGIVMLTLVVRYIIYVVSTVSRTLVVLVWL